MYHKECAVEAESVMKTGERVSSFVCISCKIETMNGTTTGDSCSFECQLNSLPINFTNNSMSKIVSHLKQNMNVMKTTAVETALTSTQVIRSTIKNDTDE